MSALGHIRVLSDGRAGHENQSMGLALALARRTGASIELVALDPKTSFFVRMRVAAKNTGHSVNLVISAGHRTHLPLWWAGRRLKARTVVIMTPSLPLACFDLALVPKHDAPEAADTAKRILTKGALNRVPEELPEKTATGLVLIGGPSNHHRWDGERLKGKIARVIAAQPELSWTIANSRRTPSGYLEQLQLNAVKVPEHTTPRNWLADELARASAVWVTSDSVSMVHEAATAGAATGVLPMPCADDGGGRPQKAVDLLIQEGLVADFNAWESDGAKPLVRPTGATLHEAARCADLILARWFASGTK